MVFLNLDGAVPPQLIPTIEEHDAIIEHRELKDEIKSLRKELRQHYQLMKTTSDKITRKVLKLDTKHARFIEVQSGVKRISHKYEQRRIRSLSRQQGEAASDSDDLDALEDGHVGDDNDAMEDGHGGDPVPPRILPIVAGGPRHVGVFVSVNHGVIIQHEHGIA